MEVVWIVIGMGCSFFFGSQLTKDYYYRAGFKRGATEALDAVSRMSQEIHEAEKNKTKLN